MKVILLLVIGASLLATPTAAPADAIPAAEVRGLWVLRTSLHSRKSIDTMVRAARAGGFNTLLVQVRGRGEAFYRSGIEPRASDLDDQPRDFDPLAATLDLAHRAGLRVHAWINVDLVSNAAWLPRSDTHVVSRHPEWLMIPKALANRLRGLDPHSPRYVGELARWTRSVSTQVEGLYLSPIPAASREYTASVIAELVSGYAIDGIHLDYMRYPNESFDYSPVALREFRETRAELAPATQRVRLDRMAMTDAAAWVNAFPESWTAFRRGRLTMLARRVHDAAKKARPEIVVSAAVGPDPDDTLGRRFQDWRGWSADGLLDVICPMAYTPDLAEFTAAITRTKQGAGTVPVWAGIGAWQLPARGTAEHVRAARHAGAAGVLLFSYDRLTPAFHHGIF